MGAMADALVAYARPLMEFTDGSQEELEKSFAFSQLCYNLALLDVDARAEAIIAMQSSLEMNDDDFIVFQQSIVEPMIRRHEEMFPGLHQLSSANALPVGTFAGDPQTNRGPHQKYAGTDPYAPCPCQSGRKYKFCCKAKGL